MDARTLIKRVVPEPMRPVARKVYRSLIQRTANSFPGNGYRGAALRCTVSYNCYGGYCVPESSRHRAAARRILANDVYEPETIEYMRTQYVDGDIVHAGTYFGDFLPALAGTCAPGARVWAFEPNPENYRCAKITLAINDISNVELTNAGLGARRESLRLKTCDSTGRALGGGSRIVPTKDAPGEAEPVQVVALDDVLDPGRRVSIVQLDVEGHEQQALTGALDTLRRDRPLLLVEVTDSSTLLSSDWFAHHVLSLGYRQTVRLHQNVAFECTPELLLGRAI